MAKFTFILALYMLAISCLPCADSNVPDECTNVVAIQTDNGEAHHHEEESCSPFCYCACCHTVCNNNLASIVITSFDISRRSEASFLPSPLKDIPHNFWQPPKLA